MGRRGRGAGGGRDGDAEDPLGGDTRAALSLSPSPRASPRPARRPAAPCSARARRRGSLRLLSPHRVLLQAPGARRGPFPALSGLLPSKSPTAVGKLRPQSPTPGAPAGALSEEPRTWPATSSALRSRRPGGQRERGGGSVRPGPARPRQRPRGRARVGGGAASSPRCLRRVPRGRGEGTGGGGGRAGPGQRGRCSLEPGRAAPRSPGSAGRGLHCAPRAPTSPGLCGFRTAAGGQDRGPLRAWSVPERQQVVERPGPARGGGRRPRPWMVIFTTEDGKLMPSKTENPFC